MQTGVKLAYKFGLLRGHLSRTPRFKGSKRVDYVPNVYFTPDAIPLVLCGFQLGKRLNRPRVFYIIRGMWRAYQ